MSLTVEQMREKLLEWNPLWKVWRMSDRQVIVVYNKEIVKTLKEVCKYNGYFV